MDDLIVPGVDNEDAYQKLVETLRVAEENGLEINWKKSTFLQKRVEYLGHKIERGYVYPSPAKIKAVQYYPTPTSRKQVQSFLGLTDYFRKFIRDYAKIARPLSDLSKKDTKFSFGIEQLRSFQTLRLSNKLINRYCEFITRKQSRNCIRMQVKKATAQYCCKKILARNLFIRYTL